MISAIPCHFKYLTFDPDNDVLFFRKDQRKQDELRMRRRLNRNVTLWNKMRHYLPDWLLLNNRNKYGLLFATATIIFGIYAYLKATETEVSIFR